MRCSFLAFLAMLSLPTLSAAQDVAVRPGDTVLFLGDSITQQGGLPQGYVTLVQKGLDKQFGPGKVKVINAGISGNRVPDLEKRLDRDVLAKKPTIVVVYIGINDVWHTPRGRGTDKPTYEAGLKNVIRRIQETGAKVILATPSVIGERKEGDNDLDKLLAEFVAVSRAVAREMKVELVDLRAAFLDFLDEHNPQNKASGILTTDGVHLNPAGNAFVAQQMLAALGARKTERKILRHIVLFKFKETSTPADVEKIVQAFSKLPEKIDGIIGYEHGTDVSPEKLAQGYTHAFVVTFPDAKTRDAYLVHPDHQAFVKLLKPHLDKVLVFDYFTKAK